MVDLITRIVKRPGLYLLLSLSLLSSADAQEQYVRFRRLTINDGLSVSSVYCIYQDSKGFMWFGTEDGLNRFDGKNITVYGATTEHHHILANKWIEIIYEDKGGMFWLGSRGGLTRYNPRNGIFAPISHNPENESTLSNDTVTAIISDLLNTIWVGTSGGLNRINRNDNSVFRINPGESELKGLTMAIHGLLNDRSGILWIATGEGLFSYDPKSGLFFNERPGNLIEANTPVYCMARGTEELWIAVPGGIIAMSADPSVAPLFYKPGFSEREPRVSGMHVDQRNGVWLKTNHGLYHFDRESQKTTKLVNTTRTTHSLMLNPVEPLVEDTEGNIWYGTFGNGLHKIDPSSFETVSYHNNPADPQSLSENSINCIFEDRSGAMWFGTFGAGISILDPGANKFTLFKNDPFNRNSLASSFIWSICQTADSAVWFGTDEKGISCYDPSGNTFRHFNHDPSDPGSLASPSVRKIYQDSRGNIWIGTDGGGLDRFDRTRNAFTHFRHDRADPSSISDNSVRAIFEDSRGRLWIGTRRGLNQYFPATRSFRRYFHDPDDPNSLPHNFIYNAIVEDNEGNLWIGTYGGGLSIFDPSEERFTNYLSDPDDPTSISDNIVFSIFGDPLGRYWIGTNSGLNMFYPATGSFRRFGLEENLANEVIYGILPDEQNNIWLSTNRGISKFSLDDFSVKNYDMNDGLQSNEFNGGAYHRGLDGALYFGGVYGVTKIDPERITVSENYSEVCFTKIEVLGKEVRIADAGMESLFETCPNAVVQHEEDFFVSMNPPYLEEIVLDYSHRVFSIEFAALNNLQPGKLQYATMMTTLDEEWNNTGFRNYVSFSNMKAGDYTLRVIARNADGIWTDPPLELDIHITPPFWNLWWFIALEVLAGLLVGAFIYIYLVRTRTNRLLRLQNEQITIANQKLTESEQNLKELNATKDKFFSIISHDLKNPFSSLLSISELMVQNFDDADREDHRDGFRKLNESLKYLYSLLENLLTWSRTQRGKIKYDPVRFNLTNLINENINLHRLQSERKGLMLVTTQEKEVYAYGDRDMINSVVRNLMNNAVKFTDTNGRIEIDVRPNDKHIMVQVKDSGIGISGENIRRLFRIDEKFKTQGTHGEKGTGLGLILCREFIERNGGTISVESTPGQGSIFSFTIPKAD
ncbi:MAG: hypothetical protein JXR52_01885 [Bacteroidales bacterium]|nr:hypothetical protein [Bacteroidales bacterium]